MLFICTSLSTATGRWFELQSVSVSACLLYVPTRHYFFGEYCIKVYILHISGGATILEPIVHYNIVTGFKYPYHHGDQQGT